jgi:hypothetical protein
MKAVDLKILIFLLPALLISCSKGMFLEANESITLSSPLNEAPCEGIISQNQLEVNFEWILKGDYNTLTLRIDELDDNKQVIDPNNPTLISVDGSKLQEQVKVNPGKWYQWKVYRENPKLESQTFTFFSEGEPSLNKAPFPVEITEERNEGGIVEFTWKEPKDDGDGINERLVYSAYFGPTVEEATTEIELNMNEPKLLTLNPVSIGNEYYIKIIAQEFDTNNKPGNASVSFLKVKVEN